MIRMIRMIRMITLLKKLFKPKKETLRHRLIASHINSVAVPQWKK